MTDPSAILALKNAWRGAVESSERLATLAPGVQALPEDAPVSAEDLDRYHAASLAQANAVMALRGLIEELRRRQATGR